MKHSQTDNMIRFNPERVPLSWKIGKLYVFLIIMKYWEELPIDSMNPDYVNIRKVRCRSGLYTDVAIDRLISQLIDDGFFIGHQYKSGFCKKTDKAISTYNNLLDDKPIFHAN